MAHDRKPGGPTADPQDISDWLVGRVAEVSGMDVQDIDTGTPFDIYGVNSTEAVSISGELADRFGARLAPTALYDHPTIDALVGHLAPDAPMEADVSQPISPAVPDDQDPVCIVGMACRFPGGSNSPEEFWKNLSVGFDASADVPAERWDAQALYDDDPDAPGATYTTKGAFVDDLAGFDAAFFGISPREALRMDPQQRMLLEVAWQALENAGTAPDRLRGSNTGVFIGMMPGNQYASLQQDRSGPSVLDDPYLGLGISSSVVAGRLSYLLDLRGPSLLLDTACSSSLVALHLAARSLRQGESDLALVGGVSAILHPDTYRQACKMRMLARDGRCKTFDAAADGFLIGEGCGVVVLERLSDARAHGHRVLAVIRGSAVNQDGTSNGLTAPNGAAQTAVIRQALANAEMTPDQVDFVEAHGSGTLLGDSIEMSSLHEVFGSERSTDRPLMVGAVKTNVGHLTGAAGMAGLMKSVLALNHGQIPPNLHHTERNPTIDWSRCPTLLPDQLTDWPSAERSRVAGVSSFGWSGTNSHVILEQPQEPEPTSERAGWQVLPLSASTPAALGQRVEELASFLARNPHLNIDDVAATLRDGRSVLSHRTAIVADSTEGATTALAQSLEKGAAPLVPTGQPGRIALLLPGTGEMRVGTGRELYETREAFRAAFDECAEAAYDLLGLDLREVIYPSASDEHAVTAGTFGPGAQPAVGDSPLHARLDVGHAAVFAVDYACARLWEDHGVSPSALIGYSLGEYIAACLAGVFSLADALRLVVRRAQLVAEAPPGAMTTVAAHPDRVAPLLGDEVVIAATNGPLTSVISGPEEAVEVVEERLRGARIAFMRIPTTRAMHSPVLTPQAAQLEALVASMERRAPRIPYVSNVTGTWITAEQACDPAYWSRHLCGTVRFAEGVERLAAGDADILLEAGPGQLASFATQILTAGGAAQGVTAVPTLPGSADRRTCGELVASALARLWVLGAPVDLAPERPSGRIVTLPGYPFEHQHLWPALQKEQTPHVATPARPAGPGVYEPVWEQAPAEEGGTPAGPFLVYADGTGIGQRLVEKLAAVGPTVTVTTGAEYARTGPTSFAIRPGERGDQQRLFADLPEHLRPRTVVHLWSVTGAPSAPNLDQLQRLGFHSLIDCVTSLAPLAPQGIRMLVVTDGAHAVDAADTVHTGKATIAGPRLTIPQEYPGWSCRTIDLPVHRDTADEGIDVLSDRLMAELRWRGGESELALRSGVRRVRRFRPAPMRTRSVTPLRDHGTYLITGGLGQIGLAIAEHLVNQAQDVRLVLIGRHGLPSRETWNERLRTAPDSSESVRIRGVLALEDRGAEVLVQAADVADTTSLRTLLDAIHRRFGAVHGVVHAAGLTSADVFATMATVSPAQVEAHFAAKVHGTLALREALAAEPLDFCLLMSSVSSVLGGLGFAAYAAANAFLDSFAEQNDAEPSGRWQSINWDTWRSTVDGPAAPGLGDSLMRYSFTSDDALRVLDGVLGGAPRLAVVQGDLDERLRTWVGGEDPFGQPPRPDVDAHSSPAQDLFARHGSAQNAVPAGNDHERQLAALWREALGHAEVGTHDNFFELGGNSLIGMQLMNSVSKRFGIALPAVALFEAPSISAMAAYIRERQEPEVPTPRRLRSRRSPPCP
ncbi:SDR family NAD(P)-dependent oxidoreductase [Streptomyces tuirus]|uniref:SDR family NAD(P)-dependent oxidoreductase n=1 Tax=Streptomyces tuirus TaxID=68278 RepID=A0A941FDM9_9ACTN|nr:SDR family NAD(P)-dependent oxidoreductase [Streptomyces tuirus]